METFFARVARTQPLSRRQRELVVGSLLGDGSLQPTTAGHCFRVHQGVKQVPSPPRLTGRGCHFRTVSHPELSEMADRFYAGRRKIVDASFLGAELTAFGLAVWIMDDGSRDGMQLRLNTQGFVRADAIALTEVLRDKFGLACRAGFDKGRPRLRFAAGSMSRLVSQIGAYVRPEMAYKVPPAAVAARGALRCG